MAKSYGFGDDDVQRYLKSIAKNEPISSEEETTLAKRIGQGDFAARNKLVEANLRFAASVALEYKGKGIHLGDLIEIANTAMITAAERFDGTKGCRFISYAVWWVRQAILLAFIEQKRVVRLPMNRIDFLRSACKFMDKWLTATGRPADAEEIAEHFGFSVDYVNDTFRIGQAEVSLDAAFNEDGDSGLYSVLEDPRQKTAEELLREIALQRELGLVLESLGEREREVIKLYFGLDDCEPQTLEAIGVKLGLTRERVRQIKKSALHRLRYPARSARLRKLAEV